MVIFKSILGFQFGPAVKAQKKNQFSPAFASTKFATLCWISLHQTLCNQRIKSMNWRLSRKIMNMVATVKKTLVEFSVSFISCDTSTTMSMPSIRFSDHGKKPMLLANESIIELYRIVIVSAKIICSSAQAATTKRIVGTLLQQQQQQAYWCFNVENISSGCASVLKTCFLSTSISVSGSCNRNEYFSVSAIKKLSILS